MSPEQLVDGLKEIGLRGDLRDTGHPDYQRCYVLNNQGVTLGRACIFRGQYSHMKWYGEGRFHGPRFVNGETYHFVWSAFLQYGRSPTRMEIGTAIHRAHEKAQARYDEKKAWREDNPKKRKKLEPPNPRRYLTAELITVMKESDGQQESDGV